MSKQADTQNIWYELDNAARIFPAISTRENTNVFRLSCELKENIDKVFLQKARNTTLSFFPYFQVVLRRGLFWHYLERTVQKPVVTLEPSRPCGALFFPDSKNLLFSVTYYRRRINLEVFHAIADGAGAAAFLRTLVYHYIEMRYYSSSKTALPPLDVEATPAQQAEDSFKKHYDDSDKKSFRGEKAFIIQGTPLAGDGIQVIEGTVSTKELLALAKAQQCTLTEYLAALLICGIYSELVPKRMRHRPVRVTIPVDLRAHFGSSTSRNFFSVVDVGYHFKKGQGDFASVLEAVRSQLREGLKPENLAKRMNYTMAAQRNIFARPVPLAIKNLVLRAAYWQGERTTTCAISNLGRVTMPEIVSQHIIGFGALLNPTAYHRLKLALVSFEDRLLLSFSSDVAETQVQKYFFRHLTSKGVAVCIRCNEVNNHEIL